MIPRNDSLDTYWDTVAGPAVQDPEQHEHRRGQAAARAVPAADQPRAAGGGGRRRARSLRRHRPAQHAAAALPLQRLDAEGDRSLQRAQELRRRDAVGDREEGRRGAAASAPGARDQDAPARAHRSRAAGDGGGGKHHGPRASAGDRRGPARRVPQPGQDQRRRAGAGGLDDSLRPCSKRSRARPTSLAGLFHADPRTRRRASLVRSRRDRGPQDRDGLDRESTAAADALRRAGEPDPRPRVAGGVERRLRAPLGGLQAPGAAGGQGDRPDQSADRRRQHPARRSPSRSSTTRTRRSISRRRSSTS